MTLTKPHGTDKKGASAIVFGGAGFIGTHLAKELAARGIEVLIADVKAPQHRPTGVEFEICDVRQPITVVRSEPFDRVYNLAAVHRTPGHEPFEYYEANVRGALNITDWMQSGGERELCFTSSIAVYGPSEELKSETTPSAPTSDYGRSKLLAEEIFGRWQTSAPDRKLVVIRPAVVFGPGEGGNFTRLAKALSRRVFVYPGRNDVIKSGGYVQDLVKAMIFAGDLSDPSLLFNYCYPHRSTISEICEAFHRVAGYPLPPMLPPAVIKVVIAVLKVINPSEKGSLSAARVKKLTASTNITPDELIRRGFTWDTDMESALRIWRELSPERFV
jgi:nucleoside-diphosphate-sugar epimerase